MCSCAFRLALRYSKNHKRSLPPATVFVAAALFIVVGDAPKSRLDRRDRQRYRISGIG